MKIYKTYLGGKGSPGTYQSIINEIPPHKTLLVPFLGNCAIVRKIKPALLSVLIDCNPTVIEEWSKVTFNLKRYHIFECNGIEYLEKHKLEFDLNTVI